jgi:hypothetical protein
MRDGSGKHPGVSDAYLKGNIGTSQEIQSAVAPPAPPLVQSDPNGVVVAEASVVGGDPIGLPLTVTLRVLFPIPLGTQSLQAIVEWGSGGFQPSSARFDLRRGQIVEVHGSWVRVKVINSGLVAINMAAFITIGKRPEGTDPVNTDLFGVGIGAFTDIVIPEFSKNVQTQTFNPAVDTYNIEFRAGALKIYQHTILAGSNGSGIIRLAAAVDTIRIANLGAAPVNGVVIFGLQL